MNPEDKFSETAALAQETKQILKEAGEEASRGAAFMKEAYVSATDEILGSLRTLAANGRLEMDQMVEGILQSLARLALEEFVFEPLEGIFNSLGKTITGQRELGGPVLAGDSYLVGERGPEVFTPTSAGVVSPMSQSPINITIVAGSNSPVQAIRRSEKQIAASVARAVRSGSASL